MNGFIKLHRKLIEWEWYSDSATKDVFLHLLLSANFKPSSWKGMEIKPGQVVVGRKKLAEELGLSERQVRTALNHLKTTNEVTIETTNRFSVLTVVNWEKYQIESDDNDQQTDQQNANDRPANDQQTTSKRPQRKNDKNDKKDKNTDMSKDCQEIIDLYNDICKSLPRCIKLSETRKRHVKARMKDGYQEEDFRKVFEKAEASDFLTGKAQKWKANFDWLINENNLLKVLEGNYDNKAAAGNPFEF